jgi:hypothetical protein
MSNAFFHWYGNLKKNDNVSLPGYTWYFTKKMYSFSFVRNEKCIARDFLFFYVNASHFIYYDIPILNKWWRATCQFGAVLWLRFHKENHAGFGHFARNTGIEKGRMTDGRHVNSRWCAWQGPTLSSQKENGWITVTWSFLERTKCRPAPPDCGVEFTGCRLVSPAECSPPQVLCAEQPTHENLLREARDSGALAVADRDARTTPRGRATCCADTENRIRKAPRSRNAQARSRNLRHREQRLTC